MTDYIRKINYYETDKMGITHHSNYIRWMEEARSDFLEQLGYGYAKLETDGIVSPVTSIECQYRHSTTFGDVVKINVAIDKYNGVKLAVNYVMTNALTGDVVFTGRSVHCFIDKGNNPIIVKKKFPEFDSILKSLAAEK